MDFPEFLSKYPKRKDAEWRRASVAEMLDFLAANRGIPVKRIYFETESQ